MGLLSYFLGIEFIQTNKCYFMHQRKYTNDLLMRFNIKDYNTTKTLVEDNTKLSKESKEENVDPNLYKHMIRNLRYLCNIKPNITYGVGLVSRYMEHPLQSHLMAVKRILKYVKGTLNLGLLFSYSKICIKGILTSFSSSDWSGDIDDRKITSGYFFLFENTIFSYSSKMQNIVALSTYEVKYVATVRAVCQANWLQNLLKELYMNNDEPIELFLTIHIQST